MIGKFIGSLFGAAPVPGIAEQASEPTADAELAQAAASLDNLRSAIRRTGAELPTLVSSQLRQIDDVLRPLVSHMSEQGASMEQQVLLNSIVCSYIPDPLRTYLALPDSARTEESGPTQLLAEQLATLEEIARDLANQVRIGAIAELSTHGRFLEDKFAPSALRLEGR
ncbi:hypothetical protein [Pseudarthrobacter sp. BIM B-2242]|uniref:hypothetical protein n=1 Tax=Pseudarthrobacter sp. BIM B-2242 TaxID=2772401 RepID=UPI00168AB614|nr:hypothetical protein [Pseudarthrobacter sp. BIM B-2242]QOD02996.1 hypothetical protein IDT60_17005 [Pseudarthrobacter sp. BIM B-2242]